VFGRAQYPRGAKGLFARTCLRARGQRRRRWPRQRYEQPGGLWPPPRLIPPKLAAVQKNQAAAGRISLSRRAAQSELNRSGPSPSVPTPQTYPLIHDPTVARSSVFLFDTAG